MFENYLLNSDSYSTLESQFTDSFTKQLADYNQDLAEWNIPCHEYRDADTFFTAKNPENCLGIKIVLDDELEKVISWHEDVGNGELFVIHGNASLIPQIKEITQDWLTFFKK